VSGIATVVSARMGSSRLTGKALLNLGGVPMVQFLLDRLQGTKLGGAVIFATTERSDDDILAARVAELGIPVFRGTDSDVAGRYLALAREFALDWMVRVTGDCPFVDAASLDYCLAQWDRNEPLDLLSTKGVFPVGIDYELLSRATLELEWPKMSRDEMEHLTLRLYRPELGFRIKRFMRPPEWLAEKGSYTVDTPDDYRRALDMVAGLGSRDFSVHDLLNLASSSK
jgi:spore coat polysaccharide biosynthesis protein SpsF (cytidylyltransferase family)